MSIPIEFSRKPENIAKIQEGKVVIEEDGVTVTLFDPKTDPVCIAMLSTVGPSYLCEIYLQGYGDGFEVPMYVDDDFFSSIEEDYDGSD